MLLMLFLIQSLITSGWSDRIVVGHDIHTSHRLLKYGGHGFGHLLRVVADQAVNVANITPDQWRAMTELNPQKFLSMQIS